jgi:ureidoacrylate peracid hydrolase
MHELEKEVPVPALPDSLVRQSTYRREGLAVFDRPDPGRTALFVMNMQNAWLVPDAPFRSGPVAGLLRRIHAVADTVRRAGGQVIWCRTTVGEPGTPAYWHAYYDHFIEPGKRALALSALRPDASLSALHPACQIAPSDWVLEKHRFSPFSQGGQALEDRLRSVGVNAVVGAGTATNVCVESTIRDALSREFMTYMPHDLVAAPTEDGHLAGLRNVMQAFADVRASGDIGLA